jgi:hypothetical protein
VEECLKVLLISDAIGLGIMEARPEPAWRARYNALRNKDLLAPDYGAMHVAAYLKAKGHDLRVINLVADVHDRRALFTEPPSDPQEISRSSVGEPRAARASRDYLFRCLREFDPEVLLMPISIYNMALYLRSLLSEIREACPDCRIITGGIYSTFHAAEILEDGAADIVVRGEGEIATAEILEALSDGGGLGSIEGISYRDGQGVFHSPGRRPARDLDSFPHPYTVSEEFNIKPRFDILSALIPDGDYIPGGGFLTSRGCPEACSFCLDPALNKGVTRFHSPRYVHDVVRFCSTSFPGGSFFFGDATFTMSRKRLGRILGLIGDLPYSYQIQTRADYLDDAITASLADCGFTTVAIGAESFNETILQRVVNKRLRVETIIAAARAVLGSGMSPVLTFIVGLPGESRGSIHRTVEILASNGLYRASFFPLVVFNGTALFDQFRRGVSAGEMERLRINPCSEEFLFTSDEYPTPEELTAFADEANLALLSAKPADL